MTVLFEIEFPYNAKVSPEQQALLASDAVGGEGAKFDENECLTWEGQRTFVVDAVTMGQLGKVEVLRVIDNAATKRLVEAGQRNTTVFNERCQVAVAGLGLLTVNQVQAEQDLCTEKLQGFLDEGWHIIAVCVQPDQRRPDYILGRTKGNE